MQSLTESIDQSASQLIYYYFSAYPTKEVVRQVPKIIFHSQCYSRTAVLCSLESYLESYSES